MKVAVVLLNWNGRSLLEQFLEITINNSQIDGAESVIYVVDNGSTDGSVEWLKSHYSGLVKVIELDTNWGFAEGYNRGLKEIEADYYLLLNTDVEVDAGWLQALFDQMEQQQDVGISMPKIKSFSSREHFEYAGAAGGFIDRWGFPFCRGRILSNVEKDSGQYSNSIDIFWASGAAFMIRAPLFHSLGGFDSRFFAHMEEIDLCWRAKREGWRVSIFPESTVYHIGGGTLPNNSPYKLFLNYRNNLFMLYKNLPQRELIWVMGGRGAIDLISSFIFFLKGQWKLGSSVWKAYSHFFAMKKELKKERKNGTLPKRVSSIYRGSIVLTYALKRGEVTFSNLSSRLFN